MGAFAYLESMFAALFASNQGAQLPFIFLLGLIFVPGLRVLFMFRGHSNWLTAGIRIVGGVIPLIVCLFLVLVAFTVIPETAGWGGISVAATTSMIGGILVGCVIAYLLGRFAEPKVIEFQNRKTLLAGRKDHLTDIREVEQQFSGVTAIDYENEFQTAAAKAEIFLGLNLKGKPVTVDRQMWKTSHVQIMGPPGTGKGILASVALTQSLRNGDAVFVFDPKDDEWAPSVYQAACKSASVPFEFVDLREPFPQINPILGASADEVEEMLYAGFELGRRGDAADFYRLDDRKAARQAASFASESSPTLAEIGSKARSSADSELMTGGKAFFAALEEISELTCTQTRDGIDFANRLDEGGCVYVIGSMRNEPIIALQKILFVRLIQLVERTRERKRHCSIFLDEFKYLLSRTALNALGSVRDKNCNILLAHQSLGDFANCGAEMSEASVRSTVLDTTPIKWFYRPADHETASWISDQTGKILVSTQTTQADRNIELSESLSSTRSVGETTRNLIDANTVQSMPKGCAVCIGTGIPKLAMAKAISVDKINPGIAVADLAIDPGIDLLTRLPEKVDGSEDTETPLEIDFDGDAQNVILQFLYLETWTHIDTLVDLIDKLGRDEIHDVLKELADAQLVRCSEISFLGDSVNEIWGISKHGITRVQEFFGYGESRPVFNKSFVNPTSLLHQMDIQRLRIAAERNGWKNWRKSRRGAIAKKGENHPDAIAVRPDGVKVAIEVERTIKSKGRYPDILAAHLHSRKLGYWDEIFYFCPDAKVKRRLERIFSEIQEVKYFGNSVKISDEHRAPFRFYAYDDDWTQTVTDQPVAT